MTAGAHARHTKLGN